MKKHLILFAACCLFASQPTLAKPSVASAAACKEVDSLQPTQLEVLQFSYQRGEAHDLGYTLAAIAWVESQAGLYPINITDPSFGVYHVNLRSAISRSEMKDTPFNRNRLAKQLLQLETSADYALQELLYWQSFRKTWRDVVSSYNAGWNIENGRGYLQKVIDKVNLLTRCADNWKPEPQLMSVALAEAAQGE